MKVRDYQALIIRGGRIVDPFTGRDEVADLAIVDGAIAEPAPAGAVEIDAVGLIVCPGLMDIHVHLREPGQTHKETIASGTAAAAAGGFTFVACMPNTRPALDEPERVRFVMDRASSAGLCEVGAIAAITRGRGGRELVDFAALRAAGAVAFSDDGDGVEDDELMRAAMEAARQSDTVLIQHCEYKAISAGGVMHAGKVARRLALPGLDPRSEEAMIERDVELCRQTGARYHVAHISTARAIEIVRKAKHDRLCVTAEVTPHHLVLTDQACCGLDPNTKMHPPLRGPEDVMACIEGLLDGTIDCIASDHAPHTAEEKSHGFRQAPPGIVGLETTVAVAARVMVESRRADWTRLIGWLTTGPAAVLGKPPHTIQPGRRANLTLIDPAAVWTVDPGRFASKGRNTPFGGWELRGRALATVRGLRLTCRKEVDLKGARF